MIPFNRASFDGRELDYLTQATRRGHTAGNGPFTKQAENLLSRMHGGSPSLLTTSCTHALEMTARLMSLRPGDEIIVPSYAFVTTASAFAIIGAVPIFADVRDDTLNIDPDHVEALINDATRAICIVHYGGVGAEPDRFAEVANRHGLGLVEDNAHGLGASYQGKTLGTFGDLSTLSFHETKNITSGEGGALVVNRPELAERARILRDKGTNRKAFLDGQVDKYTWVDIGSSWILSDLLAAILVGQLERFDAIQSDRLALWDRYFRELQLWALGAGVGLPYIPGEAQHTAHMFYLRLPSLGERNRFISHMEACRVNVVFHYQALHDSPVGRSFGGTSECPVSTRASETLVRLPLFTGMTSGQQDQVIDAVQSFPL